MIGTDILKFIEIAVLVTNGINFLTKNSCQIPTSKKIENKYNMMNCIKKF